MNKIFNINGSEVKVSNFSQSDENVSFILDGKAYSFNLVSRAGKDLIL